MSDETTLPAKHPGWTRSERTLYANATVRVLGQTDYTHRMLVEFLSGPLKHQRRWMTSDELNRKTPETTEESV